MQEERSFKHKHAKLVDFILRKSEDVFRPRTERGGRSTPDIHRQVPGQPRRPRSVGHQTHPPPRGRTGRRGPVSPTRHHPPLPATRGLRQRGPPLGHAPEPEPRFRTRSLPHRVHLVRGPRPGLHACLRDDCGTRRRQFAAKREASVPVPRIRVRQPPERAFADADAGEGVPGLQQVREGSAPAQEVRHRSEEPGRDPGGSGHSPRIPRIARWWMCNICVKLYIESVWGGIPKL